MKLWEDVINKATLGSGKLALKPSDIPAAIKQKYDLSDSQDPEEDFLRFSSLIYQYRQAGSLPMNLTTGVQGESEEEVNPYCSPKADGVLGTISEEDLPPFLKLWLRLCVFKGSCVAPEFIPE